MDETDDDMLWKGREEERDVSRAWRTMKALTVKTETVTLVGKVDRIGTALCIK